VPQWQFLEDFEPLARTEEETAQTRMTRAPARRMREGNANVTFKQSITAVSAVAALHIEFARTN
jgi:hypothetical protein